MEQETKQTIEKIVNNLSTSLQEIKAIAMLSIICPEKEENNATTEFSLSTAMMGGKQFPVKQEQILEQNLNAFLLNFFISKGIPKEETKRLMKENLNIIIDAAYENAKSLANSKNNQKEILS